MKNSGSAVAAGPGSAASGLRPVLSRRDLIVYGLVILTPTAPYPIYGTVQQASGGHATLSYLVAMVAMLFTAMSYARMSAAFPVAGSTYCYVQRGLNPSIGFLAGWAMMLDYFLIPLLSIVYAALTAARLAPQVPYLVWALVFTAAITVVNLRGIQTTARANEFLMALLAGSALLFVVLSVRYVVDTAGYGALWSPGAIYRADTFSVRTLMLGAGISALSYIGFDAVTTLAEDSRSPEKDVAFATVAVCVAQTAICALTVYLATLVWPDLAFPKVETAILDIGSRIGGAWLFGWITIVLLAAGLASAMTGQAGASRLLLGMGRDGVISPWLFGHVDQESATPRRAIWFMSAVAMAGTLLADFQLIVELLNFGAFAGFILVNLSVIGHYYVRLGLRRGSAAWHHLISPALGAMVCAYLWLSLTSTAKLVGFGWLGAGAVYLLWRSRRMRKLEGI
ncbi:MAG: APC family permease [Bryobacterales bacterium]|nr:APC family permease [Bryobacterales bacterium]